MNLVCRIGILGLVGAEIGGAEIASRLAVAGGGS